MNVGRIEQATVNGLIRTLHGEPRAEAAEEGAVLVQDLEDFFTHYVILPNFTALPLALWTMMTYTFASFDAVPYLVICSPTPRCGKTRLLECLELVASNTRRASNISEAALFRVIQKFSPTLLLDEAETLDGKGERAEYLRQILNAGNRRRSFATRCDKQNLNVEDFSVFCPKVLAGIGNRSQTITDRAIVIAMQRRNESEAVARFLYRIAEPQGNVLRERAKAFAASRCEEVGAAYEATELNFISDRDAESWAPLFAILSLSAPERLPELRACAEHLTHAKSANAEDDSRSLRLLADMRDVWPASEPRIFSAELVIRLKNIEGSPWNEDEKFGQVKLSGLLKPFGMRPAPSGSERRPGRDIHGRRLMPSLTAIWALSRHNRHKPCKHWELWRFTFRHARRHCDGSEAWGTRINIGS